MRQLIADLSTATRPFVLVLDDYQAITAQRSTRRSSGCCSSCRQRCA